MNDVDIPQALKHELIEALQKWGDPALQEHAMAFRILRHYLGEKFVQKKVRPTHNPDQFMMNKLDGGPDHFTYRSRVCSLADTVFCLRGITGFDVLIKRLSATKIRAPFFESQIAHWFFQQGFGINIKKESGIRKDDFDFTASRQCESINVEVTEATNHHFNPKNIVNKLYDKNK